MKTARSGFSLVELTIVISILVILTAISIPLTARSLMASREASAISSMRLIATAEEAFQSQSLRDDNGDGMGDYGTLLELGNPPDAEAIPFVDKMLAAGERQGYVFEVVVIPGDGLNRPAYAARATPKAYGRSGNRNFYIDEEGVLRFTVGLEGLPSLGPGAEPVN